MQANQHIPSWSPKPGCGRRGIRRKIPWVHGWPATATGFSERGPAIN